MTHPESAQMPDEIVPLERIRAALDFYAKREHWMSQTADDPLRRVLVAMRGGGQQNGWLVADSVEDDVWALGQLIEQLSQSKAEAMATIDRMNADLATPPDARDTSAGEVEKSERDMEQLIQERDDAEEAISQAYYLITGKSPEWSNAFGYAEALEEIDDAQRLLRQSLAPRQTVGDLEVLLAIRDLRCAIDNLDEDGGREHADKLLVQTAPIQARLEKSLITDGEKK